jgi:flagellar biosynthesis protein
LIQQEVNPLAEKRKPAKVAVALGYQQGQDDAPKVLAAGRGVVAENLVRIAQENAVPIHTDHPLANALIKLELGSTVPPELYAAVAEVLAFLYRLEQERAQLGWGGGKP